MKRSVTRDLNLHLTFQKKIQFVNLPTTESNLKSYNMVHYRRDYTPGATYFFTVNLRNRQSNLLTTYISHLGAAFRFAQKKAYFHVIAIVVMPEHLHAIWRLPNDDYDYSRRWRLIKGHFTRSLLTAGLAFVKDKSGEYNVWQRRFWEHRIRDEIDFQRHIDYIHYNPVKHGLVLLPREWPYSSLHRFISEGILVKDWGGNGGNEILIMDTLPDWS